MGVFMKKVLLAVGLGYASLHAYCDPYMAAHGMCTESASSPVVINNVVEPMRVDAPRTILSTSNKSAAVSAEYIYSDDYKVLNIPLGVNLGTHFGAEAILPLVTVKNNVTGDTNTGMGDILVGGNYHFGAVDANSGVNITSLLLKTTSGDTNKQLGTGKNAYTLSHKFEKNAYKDIDANLLLSYTMNDKSVSGNSYLAAVGGSMQSFYTVN
jgi:hypothetical protein